MSKRVLRADLHVHTCYSIDSLAQPEAMLEAAVKKKLSAIAITDHNEIEGAIQAARAARKNRLPLQVIIGEEVATSEGDLLVYFLKKKIEGGSLGEVLAEAKRQGAITCAAHPYDAKRHGIQLERLQPELLQKIDAIETFNARVLLPKHNELAGKFAARFQKPFIAGSDAHHPSEVGTAYTEFSGIRKIDRKNILSSGRQVSGNHSAPLVHALSRYAVVVKKLGWKKKQY
ncbi:MAG: PHP domain-containing protein [Candidatus Micrarchaeota archaeon]|nr:PHP domain-containing protein [Candidatus Micrarchaeota archaeon]